MDLHIAHGGSKAALAREPAGTTIGPVRPSDTGVFNAHISSQGLRVGAVD